VDFKIKLIKIMNDELKKLNQKLVEMNKKSFAESFEQFKKFNNFDDFVENSTRKGNKKLCSKLTSEELETFDINKSLWENMKNIMLKQSRPNFEDVKLNMAIMFAYNLDNERVVASIKSDKFWYEKIKEELIQKEMFEDIVKLEKIKQQNMEKYEIRYQIIIHLSEKEANYYKSHGWENNNSDDKINKYLTQLGLIYPNGQSFELSEFGKQMLTSHNIIHFGKSNQEIINDIIERIESTKP